MQAPPKEKQEKVININSVLGSAAAAKDHDDGHVLKVARRGDDDGASSFNDSDSNSDEGKLPASRDSDEDEDENEGEEEFTEQDALGSDPLYWVLSKLLVTSDPDSPPRNVADLLAELITLLKKQQAASRTL